MSSIKKCLFFIARFCISLIFLLAAFHHIADFDGMECALTNALYSISEHSSGQIWVQTVVEHMMSFVPLLAISALVLLVLGGGSVLLGIKYRLGATLLILVLLPTTLIMHHYYFLEGPSKELQSTMFWKNIAILGGLLAIATYPRSAKFDEGDEG